MNEAIDRTREQIDAAWLRGDADGITRHLADNAILLPPHGPKLEGRDDINAWLRGFFAQCTMTELAMPERDLTVSEDLAFERSLYQWTLSPKDGGEVIRDEANWVGIWQRDQNGAWSEICGIWNSTLPVTGSGQAAEKGASAAATT
jgi:uncharacterized protein (TIGR02246 family)